MDDHSLIQLLQQRLRFSRRIQPAHAAVLIAITNEPDPKVLLTRRSAYLNSHAGEVSFPGGKRDATDTSNIVIALREAQEETGLNPFEVELIGDLPMHRARNGMLVKPVVGLIPAGSQINKTVGGIKSIQEGGSYTKNHKLQFKQGQSLPEKAQSIIFGKYASQNAKNYFNKKSPVKTQTVNPYNR
jgi:ADP-ribose pyrophosphatase YjhB (NUDIX family)